MTAHENLTYVLNERPTGSIVPGVTFQPKIEPIPKAADLKDGEILIETLYLGLEPAMRGWINDNPDSYIPPVALGSIMRAYSTARVVSSSPSAAGAFARGDIIHAPTGWARYRVLPAAECEPAAHFPATLPHPKDVIGLCGITGLTAWAGMETIGRVKAGDTVVISAAAGATGSVAGQIARIKGAGKVVGIAGGADKCRWLKEEMGFDEAVDYKAAAAAEGGDLGERLREATGGKGVDVYFDSVGCETLDLVLGMANKDARFIMCGQISTYNGGKSYAYKNLNRITTHRVTMKGFIVLDHAAQWGQARTEMASWLAEGKLKTTETIVEGGLDKAEEALVGLFKGVNQGKLMVEVKSPNEPILDA